MKAPDEFGFDYFRVEDDGHNGAYRRVDGTRASNRRCNAGCRLLRF